MKKLAILAALVGTVAIVRAQQSTSASAPANDDWRFEVATVKQNKSADRGGGIRRYPGGRVTVTNMPVRLLITFAYQLGQYQLVGGPNWIADDKFDVTAKMEGNPEWGGPGTERPDPIMIAMRTLLSERFKLTLHTEKRDLDAYALVLAKPGTPGPQLKPSTTDCAARLKDAQAGKAPPVEVPPSFDKPMPCSIMLRIGAITFDGAPMSQAANIFVGQAGRPVVDRTGLTGNWQFVMTFAQEAPIGAPPPGDKLPAPDPNAPSFFTALQEQLGLKLESTKAPFDVTVIDAAEHPTDD